MQSPLGYSGEPDRVKPLQQRLKALRQTSGLAWEALERDYLLSFILAAVQEVPELAGHLVLKGGGCLRKCYGYSRFSEDLDFTALDSAPTGGDLAAAADQVAQLAQEHLVESGDIQLKVERYQERHPHPEGQEAFTILAKLPWQRTFHTRVLLEISRSERLLWAPLTAPIQHEYGEQLEASAWCYSRDEIVAEKLRALLQNARRAKERGWARSRARDYYDLWCLLSDTPEVVRSPDFLPRLREKAELKAVTFTGADSFLEPAMLARAERDWDKMLAPVLATLPEWPTVLSQLRALLAPLDNDSDSPKDA